MPKNAQATAVIRILFLYSLQKEISNPPKTAPALNVISLTAKRHGSSPNVRLTNKGVKNAAGLIKKQTQIRKIKRFLINLFSCR